MAAELYFGDLEVGQEFTTENYTVTKESSINFAKEYDPQYFHIDEKAAQNSPFGELVTSGWQTAAITMRLKAGSELNRVAGGLVGLGLDSVKWPKPVVPGDTLRAVITIMDKRHSQSKPTHGIVRYRMETFNQRDEKVLEMVTSIWVPC
ncbi:MAG: MaoC family dehydratase [Alphaproteobacteria bacterium]|nr:MaoC family dehydratase [Alphaproteobacteria bacterium]